MPKKCISFVPFFNVLGFADVPKLEFLILSLLFTKKMDFFLVKQENFEKKRVLLVSLKTIYFNIQKGFQCRFAKREFGRFFNLKAFNELFITAE